MKRRLKKSRWLPWLLAIYAAAMAIYFGPQLLADGQYAKFWISLGAEAAAITGLYFVLCRKERLRDERERDTAESQK